MRVSKWLFDHLIAALPDFDLQAYQHPTGRDFASIGKVAD